MEKLTRSINHLRWVVTGAIVLGFLANPRQPHARRLVERTDADYYGTLLAILGVYLVAQQQLEGECNVLLARFTL